MSTKPGAIQTGSTGNEHKAAFGEKGAGEQKIYGARINTSDSPIVSLAKFRLNSDGWTDLGRKNDMHSHGFFASGRALSALDASFFRDSGYRNLREGDFLNGIDGIRIMEGIKRSSASPQDVAGDGEGYLSTEKNGYIHYGN
ncbi:hypothetical protein [Lysobacter fragariae]